VATVQTATISLKNSARILQVKNAIDTSNFEDYPTDVDQPPDDVTGWDKEF